MATLGKNQIFEIKNGDGTSFHNLVLHKSAVESVAMSLGDKISGDVYYKNNTLSVTMHEYITYNGINYTLINPPTIIREGIVANNSELKGMTKYSFVFYHPMCQLSNFPFADVAVTSDETRYLSESKTFSWIGKPADFVAKVNKNLTGTEWIMELSSRFPQTKLDELSKVIPFDNATIADACKTFYDTWGVPYIVDKVASTEASYAAGKRFKIVVGLPSNEIYADAAAQSANNPFVFKMGHGVGLKNNSRTSRNNKIITRISGYGSENNIPYGYPQVRWYGEAGKAFTYGDHAGVYTNVTIAGVHLDKVISYPIYKGILNGEYVELIKHPFTRTHLMPSVYRTTLFNKISFLDDLGDVNTDYDPDITLVDYYDAVYSSQYPYPNTINLQAPSYESHEFADDKPELGEAHVISATPLNNDLTPASSWDDSLDDEGNYKQSYFQMVLPQLSFDLYACASITEEMQINMRSGACLGCTFTVQVDWDDYKRNFYDEDGNFAPNGSQRDLAKYPKSNQGSIPLILQKDNTTFGTIMPNIYQYPTGESSEGADDGDVFVILGISLPESYVFSAEWRLDADMKSYMLENNVHYYDYPLKFDEDFLFHNENILSQIRPNTIVRFNYAGQPLSLYVKQLTIKYGDQPLPQYDITLTDNVEVVLSPLGQVAEDVENLSALISLLRQSYSKNIWSELANKLSRVQDDTAQGLMGFVKGLWVKMKGVFGIDQDGNARVNALNAESDAHLNGQTFADDIQSSNYTGEGVADTGFRLMREDAAGSSKLVVDNLYVRKKATFEELEVRKETAIAGNQIYSGAANVILRTDYYGVDDPTNHDFSSPVKLLGYSTTVVPWLLRKVPFLLNGQFFGRLRKTRVVLEDADIPKIRLVRCYFLAKDDEKETFNLWKIQEFDANNNPIDGTGNDFARCQSFNLSSSKRKTYIRSMETKAGNVYWWRKLCGLSERPVTLDDNRQYHFIDVRFDYNEEERYRQQEQQCPWCDVASGDIPAAGDQVVQFGNDMNPDRMNLIAVEVNSSADAPAHKWYKGIYTFDLNKCWWGGNPRKDMISASSGVEFYGPEFKIVTECGIAKVPKDRAEVEWTNITPQRDDYGTHENVRKCYNYDAITHNGSRWLCLMQDGAHWVRPQVWDDDSYALFDEDGNYKHNGDFISSTEYSQLSTSRKAQCGRVADYTTKEPSTDDEVWKKIVAKGDNSVRIDLDNENDTMLYSSSKGLVSGNVVSTGTLWDGITDVTGLATWSIVATNCTATISDNTVTVTAMSAANGSVLVKALYNGINYEKALTLKRIIDGDKYELIITPNSIPYNSTADNPAATTLAIQIWKTACDGTRALSAPPTGFNLYANGNALTASETGTYSYTTDNSAIDSVAIKIATSASATDSLDSETIPVVKAANGASGSGTKLMFTAAMAADATAPTVATYNDFTWYTTAVSPTENLPCVYSALWRTNAAGDLVELLSVSLHSRYGKTGENGKDGWMITADPANVIITQGLGNNINDFSSAKVGFSAKKGGQTVSIDSLSPITGKQANNLSDTFNAAIGSGDDSKKVIVSSPKTYTPTGETDAVYYTQGGFEVIVNVTDPDSNTPISFNITVLCYANLLGTWKEGVVGDTKTEVARSLSYAYIQDGQGVQSLENIGTYVKSSTENISTLTRKVDNGKNLFKNALSGSSFGCATTKNFINNPSLKNITVDSDGYLTAVENYTYIFQTGIAIEKGKYYTVSFEAKSNQTSVGFCVFDYSTGNIFSGDNCDTNFTPTTSGKKKTIKFMVSGTGTATIAVSIKCAALRYPQLELGEIATAFDAGSIDISSRIKQTADEIETLVNDTGVDITNKNINLYADKVKFYKNKASATAGDAAKIWIDGGDGSLHAVDGNFEGTVRAKNLFHGVCIVGKEVKAYCSALFFTLHSAEPWINNFTQGEYYTKAEVIALSDGYLEDYDYGMVKCTYDADIVIVPDLYNDTSTRTVKLPAAKDFEGKIVEVIDNAYSNGQQIGDIVVDAVDGGKFSNGIGIDGVHYSDTYATLEPDCVARFYSVHDNNEWFWLKLNAYAPRTITIGSSQYTFLQPN